MGFMDQVKAAAKDLQGQVEESLSATNASRDVERAYRDLGMLAYLEATERTIVEADRQRLLETLRALEAQGAMGTFMLHTSVNAQPAEESGPDAGTTPPPG